MRTVRRGPGFVNVTCKHCLSVVEMLPDEMGTVGPPGPSDCDYDPEEVGTRYFRCPECRRVIYPGLKAGAFSDPGPDLVPRLTARSCCFFGRFTASPPQPAPPRVPRLRM
jgi:hypothetical protein